MKVTVVRSEFMLINSLLYDINRGDVLCQQTVQAHRLNACLSSRSLTHLSVPSVGAKKAFVNTFLFLLN